MNAEFIELDTQALAWAKIYCGLGLRVLAVHTVENGRCSCSKGADCASPGKHPKSPGWTKSATADYEKARELFDGSSNIGIATGSGIVVLDADGELGRHTIQQLSEQHGGFPAGPFAETGSGGLHLLFRSSLSFPNRVKLLPGLDVRGEGGQIVVAPSLHKSGRRYHWLPGPDGRPSIELPIPEAPEWLVRILSGDTKGAWDPARWLQDQAPAVEGENGSAQLMRVTGELTRQSAKCRKIDGYLVAIASWNARCLPPWSEEELRHAHKNAMRSQREQPTIALVVHGKPTRTELDRIVREDSKYEDAFSYDLLKMEERFEGEPLTDKALTDIGSDICKRYSISKLDEHVLRSLIESCCRDNGFDPAVDYLESLTWDGKPRLLEVPQMIMGTEEDPLAAAYFKRWAIGAVKRALEPGCKMDTVLILQGKQGYLKSTFFKALASPEWFSDSQFDVHDKDSLLKLHRVWIYEWAELTSIRRSDAESVKAFLSSSCDNFRAPYARKAEDHPRAGVIVGSTNRDDFLQDPAGSRRFWVIACPQMLNIKLTLDWRDQLWAEAMHLMKAGEPHWLTPEEESLREGSNVQWQGEDAVYWQIRDTIEFGPDVLSLNTVMAQCGLQLSELNRHQGSIYRALKECGFKPQRVRIDGGAQKRMWVRGG